MDLIHRESQLPHQRLGVGHIADLVVRVVLCDTQFDLHGRAAIESFVDDLARPHLMAGPH